jgi:hypothetical protein
MFIGGYAKNSVMIPSYGNNPYILKRDKRQMFQQKRNKMVSEYEDIRVKIKKTHRNASAHEYKRVGSE